MNTKKIILIVLIVIIVALSIGFIFYLGRKVFNTPALTEQQLADTSDSNKTSLEPVSDESEEDFYRGLLAKNISPDNTRKVQFEKDLKIINLKTNKVQQTEKVNLEDVNVAWIKPDEIFIIEKPSILIPSSIWSYNLKNKNLDYVFQNEPGLMANWSKDGNLVLKFNGELSLVNNKTGQVINLPFMTLPNKCAFSNDNEEKIYCAVPKTIPSSVTLPDDYLKNKFYSQDQIISLTVNPTKMQIILDQTDDLKKLDAVDLMVINDDLYFTNRYDNKIYKIDL